VVRRWLVTIIVQQRQVCGEGFLRNSLKCLGKQATACRIDLPAMHCPAQSEKKEAPVGELSVFDAHDCGRSIMSSHEVLVALCYQ
jgi:hypothetical protein